MKTTTRPAPSFVQTIHRAEIAADIYWHPVVKRYAATLHEPGDVNAPAPDRDRYIHRSVDDVLRHHGLALVDRSH